MYVFSKENNKTGKPFTWKDVNAPGNLNAFLQVSKSRTFFWDGYITKQNIY